MSMCTLILVLEAFPDSRHGSCWVMGVCLVMGVRVLLLIEVAPGVCASGFLLRSAASSAPLIGVKVGILDGGIWQGLRSV